ncbi:hypothetical protein [Mucilaginibacter sp. UYCu711]|uniref:hypothetical protein n=1 Tax=Mucilaginibacter sp. UYCu711 TaxID=3156339 RepID=UPI003D21E016
MKTLQNHSAFNGMQNAFSRYRKNQIATTILEKTRISIDKSMLAAFLMYGLLITLYGCGKPSNPPIPPPVSTVGCAITGDVDQALGSRIFEYDDKGFLIKMTGPNYYYGPFVETITSAKVVDAYPTSSVDGNGNHYNGTINTTYSYSGGSGNIYDGNPEFIHRVFKASNPPSSLKTDSLFHFFYDDAKKHLTTILMAGNGSVDVDGFTLFKVELNFTYDANDNVTQIKISYTYTKEVKSPQTGEDHIYTKQIADEVLNITYDDKPSAYTAISKYWKFIGGDFIGFNAYNLDKLRFWAGRCAILSKNNPVKITGKLRQTFGSSLFDINANLTYQYNEKNFPVSMAINGAGVQAFTYNCK